MSNITEYGSNALPSSLGFVSPFRSHADERCRHSKHDKPHSQTFYLPLPVSKSKHRKIFGDRDGNGSVSRRATRPNDRSLNVLPREIEAANASISLPGATTIHRVHFSTLSGVTDEEASTVSVSSEVSDEEAVSSARTLVSRLLCAVSEVDGNQGVSSARTLVTSLPWADNRGKSGAYTGQVNAGMRPDGRGALIYDDGLARSYIWKDGMPVQSWRPRNIKHKNKTISSHDGGYDTFLPHLNIGDVGTSQDMVQAEPSQYEINSLQNHDFAFIKRSDGLSWTYAIIASRTENTIRFVVDTDGSTKYVSRNHWQTHVRLVNAKKKVWDAVWTAAGFAVWFGIIGSSFHPHGNRGDISAPTVRKVCFWQPHPQRHRDVSSLT